MFRSGWSRLALVLAVVALAAFYVGQHLSITFLIGPQPEDGPNLPLIGIGAIVALALVVLTLPVVFAFRWAFRGFRLRGGPTSASGSVGKTALHFMVNGKSGISG